eukprot:TRINITY_DN10904_c0_g1_i1.p1 TRINITY_DN10904_c0_g1~~TRINITY_DN10904_c0_g1_i1.p1  ORF type:complete len:154 (-),score=28.34 TRINITY_DN10904_c0_g1_i1:71-532(-)
MAEIGVVGNIQPQFLKTDSAWLEKRLPPSLLEFSYVWRTLLERGIVCAGGSDAPIEFPSPFLGMHAAIFRHTFDSTPDQPKVFRSEQCLTLEQALYCYTIGGAYAQCSEKWCGQLQPGFTADFIVIDQDIIADPTLLSSVKVEQVYVAGKRKL